MKAMITLDELYKVYLQHPEVVTDSRSIKGGCLFFALKGERFNGNRFAEAAIDAGAAFAIIDESEFQKGEKFLLVEDVLETMQNLARHHCRQFQIPILAITGSNGKTTTKELVEAVLSSVYPTHCTRGNFNNHIGVPLTLLAMPLDTQIAIVEMGANHQREIDFLCRIAEPTHGLITNIGKAHLEGFGGIEGVKKGKSELYQFLAEKTSSVAFVNLDEPFLEDLAKGVRRKIFYKKGEKCTSDELPFEIELLTEKPFLEIRFCGDDGKKLNAQSNLTGFFNFNNLATAVTIGTYFKVPSEQIQKAIEEYVPSNNRSQLLSSGTNTIILDAYNANPTSMKNAIHAFDKMEGQNKVAILGAMRELGEYSEVEHSAILQLAIEANINQIVLVGPEFESLAKHTEAIFFADTAQVKKWLENQDFEQTHFLLKASRSIGLEKLVEVFQTQK